MARNMSRESEFGLPSPMPIIDVDGVAKDGAKGIAALARGGLPALTDATAVANGAVGQEAGPVGSIQQLGHELREIYAKGDGPVGPTEPPAGTN